MRRAANVFACLIAALLLIAFAGCQTANRQVPQASDQRADNQQNTTVNAIGLNYVPVYGRNQQPPATQPALSVEKVTAESATQTADGSVQGSTEQRAAQDADASGQTDQTSEPSADVDVTPGG